MQKYVVAYTTEGDNEITLRIVTAEDEAHALVQTNLLAPADLVDELEDDDGEVVEETREFDDIVEDLLTSGYSDIQVKEIL